MLECLKVCRYLWHLAEQEWWLWKWWFRRRDLALLYRMDRAVVCGTAAAACWGCLRFAGVVVIVAIRVVVGRCRRVVVVRRRWGYITILALVTNLTILKEIGYCGKY